MTKTILLLCCLQYMYLMTICQPYHQQCACLIGPIKSIYSSPLTAYYEQIGVLITGECLPVAEASDDMDWLSVNFQKNILFHHLTVVGFIKRDTDIVFRSCDGSSGSLLLTTSMPQEITTILASTESSKYPSTFKATVLSKSSTGSFFQRTTGYLTNGTYTAKTSKSLTTTTSSPFNASKYPEVTTSTSNYDITVATFNTIPETDSTTESDLNSTTSYTITTPTEINSTPEIDMNTTTSSAISAPTEINFTPKVDMNTTTSSTISAPAEINSTPKVDMNTTTSSTISAPTEINSTPKVDMNSTTSSTISAPAEINSTPEVDTNTKTRPLVSTTNGNPINVTEFESSRHSTGVTASEYSFGSSVPESSVSTVPLTQTRRPSIKTTELVTYSAELSSGITFMTTVGAAIVTKDSTSGGDPCQQIQCKQGSTCLADPIPRCVCEHFRHGPNCELCGNRKCANGSCLSILGQPKCICSSGFTGESCDEIHICGDTEISVGGECYQLDYTYETCKTNLCSNYSLMDCLVNSLGIYCLCSETFDPVNQNPCGCPSGSIRRLDGVCVETDCRGVTSCQHGTCYFKSFYSYGCMCEEGWQGENCDVADPICGSNHCHNNGTCLKDPNPQCACTGAWTGPNCTECGDHYCEHGVCLLDSSKQSHCVCDKEYTGPNCDTVSDCKGQTIGGYCYQDVSDQFTYCAKNVCPPGEICMVALHTYKNDIYCVCNENVTLSFLASECGCPERTLRNLQGECVHLLL